MSKFLNLDNVLCFSPHPDDVEYGMLGNILKHKDTNFDILVFSCGGDFDKSSSNERYQECKNIWNEIENLEGFTLPIKHLKNMCEDELVNITENFIKEQDKQYDCILCPPSIDSHFEHRLVNQISSAVVRRSKCGVINYKTPSTLEDWIPNTYVEINLKNKSKYLEYFKSQTNKSFFNKGPLKAFHTDYGCLKRNIECVEMYKIIKLYN
tara:strand:- start:182 stop:808 length:627 start_codon:yes stop_codon:yes gene_type:complete